MRRKKLPRYTTHERDRIAQSDTCVCWNSLLVSGAMSFFCSPGSVSTGGQKQEHCGDLDWPSPTACPSVAFHLWFPPGLRVLDTCRQSTTEPRRPAFRQARPQAPLSPPHYSTASCRRRSSATSRWPFFSATCTAVRPLLSGILGSAAAARSSLTHSICPLRAAQ